LKSREEVAPLRGFSEIQKLTNESYPIWPNQPRTNQPHRTCDRSERHSRAVVRHVERLDGPARNLCRDCWRQVVATEARAVLVARWNSLWNVCLWVFGLRGAIRALAVILAPIGASRGGRGL
jgi:hypothetical protein